MHWLISSPATWCSPSRDDKWAGVSMSLNYKVHWLFVPPPHPPYIHIQKKVSIILSSLTTWCSQPTDDKWAGVCVLALEGSVIEGIHKKRKSIISVMLKIIYWAHNAVMNQGPLSPCSVSWVDIYFGMKPLLNSLASGGSNYSLKLVNFKLISTINISSIFCEIATGWMPQHLTDQWSLVNIGSGNGFVMSGNKPLP